MDNLQFLSDKTISQLNPDGTRSMVESAYWVSGWTYLKWCEVDEYFRRNQSGNPERFDWMTGLLERWKDAGRPCPREWNETSGMFFSTQPASWDVDLVS